MVTTAWSHYIRDLSRLSRGVMALEHFLNLPEHKQKEIISAALKEFSQCGYDLASTNRIVADAGISKGVLFKYFPSKETLFRYVVSRFEDGAVTSPDTLANFKDIFDFIEYTVQQDIAKAAQDEDEKRFFLLVNKMALDPEHPVYSRALAGYWGAMNQAIAYYCDHLDERLLREGLTAAHLKSLLVFLLDSMRAAINKEPTRLFDDSAQVLADAHLLLSVVRAGVFR